VRNGILFSCGVLLIFLYLAYRILHWMLARWGESWGIRREDDLASCRPFGPVSYGFQLFVYAGLECL